MKEVEVTVINKLNGFYLTSKNIEMVVMRVTHPEMQTVKVDLQKDSQVLLPVDLPLNFEIFAYLSQSKNDFNVTVYQYTETRSIPDGAEVVDFTLNKDNSEVHQVNKVFFKTQILNADNEGIGSAQLKYQESFTEIEVESIAGEGIYSSASGNMEGFYYFFPGKPFRFNIYQPNSSTPYSFGFSLETDQRCLHRLPNIIIHPQYNSVLSYGDETDFDRDGVPNDIEDEGEGFKYCADTDQNGVSDLDQYFPSPIIRSIIGDSGKEGVFRNSIIVQGEYISSATKAFLLADNFAEPKLLTSSFNKDSSYFFIALPEDVEEGKYQLKLVNFINEATTHLSILRGNNALIDLADPEESSSCPSGSGKVIKSGVDYNADNKLDADEVLLSSEICLSAAALTGTNGGLSVKDGEGEIVGMLAGNHSVYKGVSSDANTLAIFNTSQSLLFNLDKKTGKMSGMELLYEDGSCTTGTPYVTESITDFGNSMAFRNGSNVYQPGTESLTKTITGFLSAEGNCTSDFDESEIYSRSNSNYLWNGPLSLEVDSQGITHILAGYYNYSYNSFRSEDRAATLMGGDLYYGQCKSNCGESAGWTFIKVANSGTGKQGMASHMALDGDTLYISYLRHEGSSSTYYLASCSLASNPADCSDEANFSSNWSVVSMGTSSDTWAARFTKIFVSEAGKMAYLYTTINSKKLTSNNLINRAGPNLKIRFCSSNCGESGSWSGATDIKFDGISFDAIQTEKDEVYVIYSYYNSLNKLELKSIDLDTQSISSAYQLGTNSYQYSTVHVNLGAPDSSNSQEIYLTTSHEYTRENGNRTGEYGSYFSICTPGPFTCTSEIQLDSGDMSNQQYGVQSATIHDEGDKLSAYYYKITSSSQVDLLKKTCTNSCSSSSNWSSSSQMGYLSISTNESMIPDYHRYPVFKRGDTRKIMVYNLGQKLIHSGKSAQTMTVLPVSVNNVLQSEYSTPLTISAQ